MTLKCKIGLHSWEGCKCIECGKVRNEKHHWEGCECSICGKTRDEQHDWSKDCERCILCGKTRINVHDWTINCERCSICGKHEDHHDWSQNCERCAKCGKAGDMHNWNFNCDYCFKCGKKRQGFHDWSQNCEKCSKCGQLDKVKSKHIWAKDHLLCSVCGIEFIEWAIVPAGSFEMGSSKDFQRGDDEVLHTVSLNSFKISKYTITYEQFEEFVQVTGYLTDAEIGNGYPGRGSYMLNGVFNKDSNWRMGVHIGGNFGSRPVIHVSWNDAKAFAEWLGCRLPTEAEWEYSCRAGSTTPFNLGNTLSHYDANIRDTDFYNYDIVSVGSYKPNAWGIFDMHGNVREWCADIYKVYPTEGQLNVKEYAGIGSRVIRGGSYQDLPYNCRSAKRSAMSQDSRDAATGFRIVKEVS